MYTQKTKNISVTVTPIYLEDQSEPEEDHYVWAYQVRIENDGVETVQLRSRHWRITDANGLVQEVRGAGVVGEQPVLEPGESFEYTSGTPAERTRPASWSDPTRCRPMTAIMIEVGIPAFLAGQPAPSRAPELDFQRRPSLTQAFPAYEGTLKAPTAGPAQHGTDRCQKTIPSKT